MKRVSRAQLRGKPLDADCKKAQRVSNEYVEEDKRVFCFGLFDMANDEVISKCRECMAYVENAEPLYDPWDDYDHCYECRGLGDDWVINDDG